MHDERAPKSAAHGGAHSDSAAAVDAETAAQRINRELIELLNEIRVALPGVQVLLAFLLAVPFSNRFARATSFQRGVYFTTVVLTVITTVVLIAPSAYHRLNFRRRRKDRILFVANRLTIVGLALLALSLTGVVVLITSVVYSPAATVAAGVLAMVLMFGFWFVLPRTHEPYLSDDELAGGDDPLLATVHGRRRHRLEAPPPR